MSIVGVKDTQSSPEHEGPTDRDALMRRLWHDDHEERMARIRGARRRHDPDDPVAASPNADIR